MPRTNILTICLGSSLTLLAACNQQSASDSPSAQASERDDATKLKPKKDIAALATAVAESSGGKAELLEQLEALDHAITGDGPQMPAKVRVSLTQDLQSARDAAKMNDWPAVKEAARSITQSLDSTRN